MCSHCGQHVEEALQSVAVTGRKQKNQELEGMLLVCTCQCCRKKSHHIWCQWHIWKNHRKQDDCCWFDGWCMCAPHTGCWWRPCRALLLAAAQACLWGTLSVMQPRRGRCAPHPNEPPIPGQIPCKAGRDFLISQSSSKMDLVIQYEAPQMRSYLPHSLSGTPNAKYSNCL